MGGGGGDAGLYMFWFLLLVFEGGVDELGAILFKALLPPAAPLASIAPS